MELNTIYIMLMQMLIPNMSFCVLITFLFSICSVPIFKSFPEDTLIKISDVLEETHYQQGDYIVSLLILRIFEYSFTFMEFENEIY